MMGIGPMELILLFGCLGAVALIVAAAVGTAVALTRRSKPDTTAEANAYLSAENQRLREELARLKQESG